MDTQQIPQDRLAKFFAGFIAKGSHERFEAGACALEWVAYLAGEPHSDHPACSSRVIGALVIRVNDLLDDAGRQRMKTIIPKLIGTAASYEVEQARGWLAADWSVRFATPVWLDLAGLNDHAAVLRALPEITAETCHTSRAPLRAAREASFGSRTAAFERLRKRAAAADAVVDADAAAAAAAVAGAAAAAGAVAAAGAAADAVVDADAAAAAVAGAAAAAVAGAAADAVADAAAVADADAAAAAAAAAVGVAAAKKVWGAKYSAAYNAVYPIIKKATEEKLRTTTFSIQDSCFDLIERMIALRAA